MASPVFIVITPCGFETSLFRRAAREPDCGVALADDRHRLARAANGFHLPAATFTELQFGIGKVKMIAPTMKARALIRWRRKAVAAKRLATSFQTPFAKRGMVQVVATYKVLAQRAARRQRAERRLGFYGPAVNA